MFSSLFSKALELFGKSFLLSSFFPCLIVFSFINLLTNAEGFKNFITALITDKDTDYIARIVTVLFLLYFTAYIIYSLRDAIVFLINSAAFKPFHKIKESRIEYFVSKRNKIENRKTSEEKRANAIIWAELGFNTPSKEYVLIEEDESEGSLQDRIENKFKDINTTTDESSAVQDLLKKDQKDLLLSLLHLLHQFSLKGNQVDLEQYICWFRELAKNEPERLLSWYRQLKEYQYRKIAEPFLSIFQYPPARYIQPTALGNVLSWIATYPKERYGIEMEFLIPLLYKVIDKEYSSLIEERKIFFDFTIIMVFLCAVTSTGLLFYSGFSFYYSLFQSKYQALILVAAPIIFVIASIVFYLLSLLSARSYGVMLKSAMDLYRLKVLDELRIPVPKKLQDEKEIWKKLNQSYLVH